MKSEKIKNIAYWVTTILGPASFVIGGVINLLGTEQAVTTLHHLGYPAYFASILGRQQAVGGACPHHPGFPAPEGVGLCRLHDRPGLRPHRPSRRRGWARGVVVVGRVPNPGRLVLCRLSHDHAFRLT